MLTKQTTIALAVVLGTVAGTSPSLMADPPNTSEAEIMAQDTDLTLDLAAPRRDASRARYVPMRRVSEVREESESELSIEFGPMLMGAFQDPPHDSTAAPAASQRAPITLSRDPMKTPVAGHPNLAEAATNPTAMLIQLQFQNVSNFNNASPGGGYSNSFIIQPVVPFTIGKQQFFTRTTFPLLATTGDLPSVLGGRHYGTGDLVFLGMANFPIKGDFWGGTLAAGLAATFPTASDDLLGAGKWQLGPAIAYINTATPRLQWGALVYQQWSYGSSGGNGSRPEVSKMFFEVLVNYHFDDGWYVSFQGDQLWSLDWNDNDQWDLPIAFRAGRVFKAFGTQHVNLFFQPFYNVTYPDSGGSEWGFKISFTFLFPG